MPADFKKEDRGEGVNKIIARYAGVQIDYETTTYYPNGFIGEEKGIPAILVLEDSGGWTVTFSEESESFHLANASKVISQSIFANIASDEIELEDTTGIAGALHLNGTIVQSKQNGLSVKGASKVIINDWGKIGERCPYETVVVSDGPPYEIQVIFHDGTIAKFSNVFDAINLINRIS